MVAAPLVLLIGSEHAEHHAQSLWRDGFRVVPVPAKDANIGNVLAVRPAIVVAELIAAQAVKHSSWRGCFASHPKRPHSIHRLRRAFTRAGRRERREGGRVLDPARTG